MATLPHQSEPVPVAEHTTACAATGTLVHRTPAAARRRRTAAFVGGGLATALVGVALLVLEPDAGDGDPRLLGVVALLLGLVTVAVGWRDRTVAGWALTREGVTTAGRTLPWERVSWFGIVVDLRRDDKRTRQSWRLACNDRDEGLVDVGAPVWRDADDVEALARTVAAAWLLGVAPASVPHVVAPPPDAQRPVSRDELAAAWESVSSGRWTQLHDRDRLDDAVVLPAHEHGAGLQRLDGLVPSGAQLLEDHPMPRGRARLRIGGASSSRRRGSRQ